MLRRHDTYLDRAIAALEAEKTLTAKQKQRLIDLYGERDRTDADIQGIVDRREADAEARRKAADAKAEERKRKQEAAAAKRKEEAKRAAEEAERQWQEIQVALTSPSTWAEALAVRSEALNAKFAKSGISAAEAASRSKTTDTAAEKGLTVADVNRMHADFLTNLHGTLNQFGGNLFGDQTQTATNTWRTSKLLEQQNVALDRLARGVAHPGARYARTELEAAYGGATGV